MTAAATTTAVTRAVPLMLFDAHVHVVADDAGSRYPRTGPVLANGAWWDDGDFSVGAFQNNVARAAVERAVLVQATGTYGSDNRYLVDAVAHDPEHLVGVAVVDPTSAGAKHQLARLVEQGVRGIRLFHIPTPSPSWLASPACDEVVDMAHEAGWAITICIQNHDLSLVSHQLQRRPDVTFTLDHCGFPDLTDGPPFAGAAPLWTLSEHDNLHVKFSPTLAAMADDGVAAEAVLSAVVDRFGSSRVMLGTDWPQHRDFALGYRGQVEALIAWTEGYRDADRRAMLSANTARLFGSPESVPT